MLEKVKKLLISLGLSSKQKNLFLYNETAIEITL